MIDRVGAAAAAGQLAATGTGRAGSAEIVSIQLNLAREQYQSFLDALAKAGVDLSAIQAPATLRRQEADSGSGLLRICANQDAGNHSPAAAVNPAPKTPEPFQPEFLSASVNSSLGAAVPLNPHYFATQATAQWMADRYGTGEIVSMAPGGEGGPFHIDQREWHFRLANGTLVNAGVLAAHYAAESPELADQVVRRELKQFGRQDEQAPGVAT